MFRTSSLWPCSPHPKEPHAHVSAVDQNRLSRLFIDSHTFKQPVNALGQKRARNLIVSTPPRVVPFSNNLDDQLARMQHNGFDSDG
eukprot:2363840-Pleurochrysis_carterae.AAC.1